MSSPSRFSFMHRNAHSQAHDRDRDAASTGTAGAGPGPNSVSSRPPSSASQASQSHPGLSDGRRSSFERSPEVQHTGMFHSPHAPPAHNGQPQHPLHAQPPQSQSQGYAHQPYQRYGDSVPYTHASASSSRRPSSAASQNHPPQTQSPSSIASSSRLHGHSPLGQGQLDGQDPRDPRDVQRGMSLSGQVQGPGSAYSSPPMQHQPFPAAVPPGNSVTGLGGASHLAQSKPPRIMTSMVDYDGTVGENHGPRSAPVNAPYRPPQLSLNGTEHSPHSPGQQPVRSSSSPDPRTGYSSNRSSPVPSPTDFRFAGPSPILGQPLTAPASGSRGPSPSGLSTSPLPPSAVPQRVSSHQDLQEQRLGSQSSHQSLADSTKSGATIKDGSASSSSHTPKRGRGEPTFCGSCGQVVHGQFVRAMGKVYHLTCFRCKDCNKVVAQKFFPVEDADGTYPLCERDYFARLDLICAKCDQALRSSYITACGRKFHVEHFTCSECDVLFGPNDSYYEHAGKVYCHFHYSTKFAVKCTGCENAILKQFVEMNRNGRDECWHPECYMISKFWNVRLASKNFNTPANSAVSSAVSLLEMTPNASHSSMSMTPAVPSSSPGAVSPASEISLTPEELKDRQDAMEMKVQQIWHVLSGYEESSAALIGDMLRAVNNRQLLEIVLLAERFILHVETLFAVIDDLEAQFALSGAKGMSHAREAKQLCRKLVNLFSTMSQISPHGGGPPSNQELFNLITQLAHYLKILIRIALTGSIKLERDQHNPTAMPNALARLNLLAMDNGDPTVRKRGDFTDPIQITTSLAIHDGADNGITPTGGDEEVLKRAIEALTRKPQGYIASTQGLAYGYRSLAPEVTGETSLRGPKAEDYLPLEGCSTCRAAIEEDCVRLGMFNRWHSQCLACEVCHDTALVPSPAEDLEESTRRSEEDAPRPTVKFPRRPPPRVDDFFYDSGPDPPTSVYCLNHKSSVCRPGFQSVSRLEQYAFLLHIALRRLYVHFRLHHQLPSIRDVTIDDGFSTVSEVKRMKSVTLDRKLSSTARLPQRSTVVESPAGRMADANGQVVSARSIDDVAKLSIDQSVSPGATSGDEPETPSSTVDVLRPPFARNNTSVMIINEGGPVIAPGDQAAEEAPVHARQQEDDAITLGDIPMLAASSQDQSYRDGRALLSTLNPLQSLIIKHFALLQLLKTGIGHLIELDEVLELLDARKGQWWNKLFKPPNKKDQKKKGTFGVPIEVLVERTGSDSQFGASNAVLRVPEFIEDIVGTMRQMDMAIEGIFRKNGNIRKLQTLCEAIDKDATGVNLSEENPVQLAALLKRFLRELPDPLLTFRMHKLFCAAASLPAVEDRQRCLHLLITLLPRYNRDTMEVLFVFLRWVASFSYRDEETGSKMDMPNLATVICPSILYAKGANAAKDESFIAIQAVQDLLENQDDYYHVPNELLFVINENIYAIFAKELDLPPKEIHRHCSKYMQHRGPSSRLPPPQFGPQAQVRPSPDPRMSVHRSDGSLSAEGIPTNVHMNGSPVPGQLRQPPPIGQQSRPNSWVQGQHGSYSSSSNLHGQLVSPPPNGQQWRGPFQGREGRENGSRNSSRGSAPSSPGADLPGGETGTRRSLQVEREMERERSRTPNQIHLSEGYQQPAAR